MSGPAPTSWSGFIPWLLHPEWIVHSVQTYTCMYMYVRVCLCVFPVWFYATAKTNTTNKWSFPLPKQAGVFDIFSKKCQQLHNRGTRMNQLFFCCSVIWFRLFVTVQILKSSLPPKSNVFLFLFLQLNVGASRRRILYLQSLKLPCLLLELYIFSGH